MKNYAIKRTRLGATFPFWSYLVVKNGVGRFEAKGKSLFTRNEADSIVASLSGSTPGVQDVTPRQGSGLPVTYRFRLKVERQAEGVPS